jgi:phosphatidylglycerol lysyltransferase
MLHILAVSEVLACASASASTLYLTWRRTTHKLRLNILPQNDDCDLANLQQLHGYNEHTFVLDPGETRVWSDIDRGAVCYVERGNVWIVTGEPLAAENDLLEITQKFVAHAEENGKIVVFLPTTERFARAVAGRDYRIHKIATSPYFDLKKWDPRGNSAKHLRSGLNRARRAGVTVEPVTNISDDFRREVAEICKTWLGGRSAGMSFGWLFSLHPFNNAEAKKYFAARDADGKLVGLLAASPIPARDGWYLEDVLRSADAPDGTSEILVFETLRGLAAAGYSLATLGTVPLSDIGRDDLTSNGYLLGHVLGLTRKNLKPIYNIEGLRCFKSKFVPSWWESEYVVASKGYLCAPRSGIAILRVIFGGGSLGVSCLLSSATRSIRPRRKSNTVTASTTPPIPASQIPEKSLNQKGYPIVKLG